MTRLPDSSLPEVRAAPEDACKIFEQLPARTWLDRARALPAAAGAQHDAWRVVEPGDMAKASAAG
jgi:hypothetical protein